MKFAVWIFLLLFAQAGFAATEKPAAYGTTPELVVERKKVNYWSLGFGPSFTSNMRDGSMMYGFLIGHTWMINRTFAIKLTGNADLSSGSEGARFFNLATGASFFLPELRASAAPFLLGEVGYGFAEDSRNEDTDGVSVGGGAGIQFFRNTETTMDLLLQYTVVLHEIQGNNGNPSLFSIRAAVNF